MGGGGAHAGHDVLVGGHGEAGMRMAEAFGHDLDRRARAREQGGVGVAQIVKPDCREIEACELAGEELADRFRMHWEALGVGEDRVVEVDAMSVSLLAALPAGEDGFGVRVEVDAASTVLRLARDLDAVPANGLSRAGDRDRMGTAVPVSPAQPGEFAATHAGGRCEVQRRVETEVLGGGEEGSELVDRPRFGSLLARAVGRGAVASRATLCSTRWMRAACFSAARMMTWTS